MNTTQKCTSFLLSLALMASCSNHPAGSNIIHVNDAKKAELNLSDYVVSLEYIPLETKQECLIDGNPNFYVLTEYIIATTRQQCFLFDRNGKFIREIGRPGRGPDEYSSVLWGEIINEKNNTILVRGWDKLIEYSFHGTVIKFFPKVPDVSTSITYESDSILVQGVLNSHGNAINQLVFSNEEKVVDSIPNYQFFKPFDPKVFGGFAVEFSFYRYRNDLYYKNMFNDTLFQIKERKLHPQWVFDMGPYHLPRSVMANMNTFMKEASKYNRMINPLEADPFLLFSILRESGDSTFVYDKHKRQLFEMQKEQKIKGFYNDIDGGFPFWPTHINQKQEMVSFLYPYEMKDKLTNDYFERKNIRDMAANQRLRELLERIEDEDNPVVVIARIK